MQPKPLKVDAAEEEKLVFFLLVVVSLLLVLEKVERKREEMVDLQQRVDWIMEGICGFGSVSVTTMVLFLGLLHFMCSATVVVVVSVTTGMFLL